MGPVAHAYVLLLVVGVPVLGAVRAARLRREGDPEVSRVPRYLRGIAVQWGLVALLGGVALVEGLGPADLGLRPPSLTLAGAVAVAATALVSWRLVVAIRAAGSDPGLREAVRDAVGGADVIVPRTLEEVRVFRWLALTAGVCEELIFRGFLFAWLGAWMALPGVVVTDSVLFGVGHAYQGATGMLKTGLVGLALALAYVATDSLWLPMVAHAALDLLQGELLVRAAREYPPSS
jgi:membrane protease YdiL (CAAX protease family)